MLVEPMLASLLLSAGLPRAFEDRELWVGSAYAVMQIGRSWFAVVGLRGDRLQHNFRQILVWCPLSGALAVLGGFAHGDARPALCAGAVGLICSVARLGFDTPGLGRSTTVDWTISGSHLAERCHAFVLIALGESIVVVGTTLVGLHQITAARWVHSSPRSPERCCCGGSTSTPAPR